eukprot:9488371-Pyramimonas_sp.AAC.1
MHCPQDAPRATGEDGPLGGVRRPTERSCAPRRDRRQATAPWALPRAAAPSLAEPTIRQSPEVVFLMSR